MKNLFLVFFFFYSLNTLSANCGLGLGIYPTKETINPNTNFIISCSYSKFLSEVIKELDNLYPIYLESENDRIRLVAKEHLNGKNGFTQIVLYPECNLTAGQRYNLKVENLDAQRKGYFENKIRYINEVGRSRRVIGWLVSAELDMVAPTINELPRFLENKIEFFGCGTAVNAIFEYDIYDDSELLFLTELLEVETGEIVRFYIKPYQLKLYIGVGMCGGPFPYKRDCSYVVRFKVYDINGNEASDWTEGIDFENPSRYS